MVEIRGSNDRKIRQRMTWTLQGENEAVRERNISKKQL